MLDKLIESAALVLVIVPRHEQNQDVIASITDSLAKAQSGNKSSSLGGTTNSQRIDAETVAVITAAASHVIGKAFQIKKIQFLNEQNDSSWSRMGKLSVFASHDIKRY